MYGKVREFDHDRIVATLQASTVILINNLFSCRSQWPP